jgi:hypothetical protein
MTRGDRLTVSCYKRRVMLHRLTQIALRTPLAEPVRWLYRRICPLSVEEKNNRYDAETLTVMKRILKENSNCVDVGAHSGSILRLMLECAPRGQHFAFEPLPDFAKGLRASFAQVRVFELALSDTQARSAFNASSQLPLIAASGAGSIPPGSTRFRSSRCKLSGSTMSSPMTLRSPSSRSTSRGLSWGSFAAPPASSNDAGHSSSSSTV